MSTSTVCHNNVHFVTADISGFSDIYDITTLQAEIQELVALVGKLTLEFKEIKGELEASRVAMDLTRCTMTSLLKKLVDGHKSE